MRRSVETIVPCKMFSWRSFSRGQKAITATPCGRRGPVSTAFKPGCRASQILKTLDTNMRLLRAFIDWILRRRDRQPEQEMAQHSADDPWVLQQIEKFERELKR
jgi:hypothetical protein